MKLLRKLIDGNIFVNEQESGIFPTKISFDGTIDSGWEDISTLENLVYYKERLVEEHDYLTFYLLMFENTRYLAWNSLTTSEKQIIVDNYGKQDDSIKEDFMVNTQGYTQNDATQYVFDSWFNHYTQLLAACVTRTGYFVKRLYFYFNREDVSKILNTIYNIISCYKNNGVIGLEYGDDKDGIYDWINSLNEYVGNGLNELTYTPIRGDYTQIISDFNDIIVSGNFDRIKDEDLKNDNLDIRWIGTNTIDSQTETKLGDLPALYSIDNIGNVEIDTIEIDLPIYRNIISTRSSVYKINSIYEMEILSSGKYLIQATFNVDNPTNRTNAYCQLALDKNDGNGYSNLEDTKSFSYNRNTTQGKNSITTPLRIASFEKGYKLKLVAGKESGQTTTTIPNLCSITILKYSNEVDGKPPVINTYPSNYTITTADTYEFVCSADENIESWTLNSPPTGMTINEVTGKITYENPVIGSHYIGVTCSNKFGYDTKTFTLTVDESVIPLDTIIGWWKAEDITSKNNKDINKWESYINEKEFIQNTKSYKPVFRENRYNGEDAVEFESYNNLTLENEIELSGEFTIAIVLKRGTGNTGISEFVDSEDDSCSFGTDESTNLIDIKIGNNYNDYQIPATYLDDLTVMYVTRDASNNIHYSFNSYGEQLAFSTPQTDIFKLNTIGCCTKNIWNYFLGDFTELVVYSSKLDASEKSNLINYLTNKYNIV